MGKEESLDKIGYIFSLIMSEDYDASITSLAEACHVPIGQARKMLAVIADNSLVGGLLDFEDADYANAFQEAILSGKYDSEHIVINWNHYNPNEILLPVTAQERGYLKAKYPALVEKEAAYDIKDIVPSVAKSTRKKYSDIKNALKTSQIKMIYQSKDSPRESIICTPVTLIHDLSTNCIYFADTRDKVYRLDYVKDIDLTYKVPADMTGYKPNPNQPYTWGAIIDREAQPKHVKVKIDSNIRSNTWSKIERDLEWRQEKRLYERDGITYYEDYVIDLDNFYKWFRKYGSSLTVIEPQELIDMVLDETRRIQKAYEMLDNQKKIEAILDAL